MQSVDILKQNVDKLAVLFPSCVSEGKVNFEALKQLFSDKIIDGDEAYNFTWVGKKAAVIEAHTPIRKTLRPCVEESVNWDKTENLYIEGDNLEVLKLLQESYLSKVKMIYIDPPYNTGNDFIYRDDFSIGEEEYAEMIGNISEGERLYKNTDSNGRFHSDWCSMIYSRLLLARNLLTDDGVIFISIDDNEQSNLKSICDEVFGESNFIAQICIKRSGGRQDSKYFAIAHEYALCYVKNPFHFVAGSEIKLDTNYPIYDSKKQKHYKRQLLRKWGENSKRSDRPNLFYSILAPDGTDVYPMLSETEEGCWRWGKEKMQTSIDNGLVEFIKKDETWIPYEKIFEPEKDDTKKYTTWIDNFGSGTKDLKNMMKVKVFNYSKSYELICRMIKMANCSEGIVMDFFSGSATTAHAVMQLNAEDGGHRKFIMVQLPEITDEKSEAFKAGYKNICEIGKERIRRAGNKIKADNPLTTTELDVGFRVFKLDSTNMNDVYYSPDEYSQDMLAGLESNIKDDRTALDLLFGCILDWGLPLSLPYTSEEIDGCTIHDYNEGDLIACFDKNIPKSVIEVIAKKKPLRAVFRDSSFEADDDRINVEEIFKLYAPDTRVKVI